MNTSILSVLVLALAASMPVLAQRDAPVTHDAWGYRMRTSPHAVCPLSWIDTGTGTPLALTAAGDADADDDGGAAITLPQPMRFYGESTTNLVVSSNGYLAFADGTADEDGGHWRSDCPLPAIPDNRHARFGRVYAALADLERGPAGTLRWAHFTECPRAGASGVDACTVVEWNQWKQRGTTALVDMQVVLYHAHGEIAVQYGALDAGLAATATFGIQDPGARSALQVACAGSVAPAPSSAVCYFDDAPSVQIETTIEPVEAGTTQGDGRYVRGDEVVVEATAASGWVFLDWRESGVPQSNLPAYAFSGVADRQLVARFASEGDVLFRDGFDAPTTMP